MSKPDSKSSGGQVSLFAPPRSKKPAKTKPLTGLESARKLFKEAGLAFPKIPEELATRLMEFDKWLYSTRNIHKWPYWVEDYVKEADNDPDLNDYVVLCNSGHGINSYALQYYLVREPLFMFLHLAWGGVYLDFEKATAHIGKCFSLADEVVDAVTKSRRLRAGERLLVVATDFYGGYWTAPGRDSRIEVEGIADREIQRQRRRADVVLGEALAWLRDTQERQQRAPRKADSQRPEPRKRPSSRAQS